WIKDNIATFGGDPDMVVLMGQSAGGKSVANLMVTPLAKGLFHRAIIQSGSIQCIRDTQTARNITKLLLDKLGIFNNPEQILVKGGEDIIAAQKELYEVVDSAHVFGPVLDGRTIMEDPKLYIEKGKVGDIPVLIGFNKEELFYSDSNYNPTEEEIRIALIRCYGENWEFPYCKYQELKNDYSAAIAFDMTQTLCVYGNATIALTQMLVSAGNKVWSYRWDYGGEVGRAQHSSELPYIFGYANDNNMKHSSYIEVLSQQMNETWMSFICKGSPENKNIPIWPLCDDAELGYRMHIDKVFHLEHINLHSYYHEFPMQVIKI
ncbi:MAG: carboxylesterase family protein, partial [Clostridiales bacterium]|nr:carboxylesterase family protein [Clostridiales bacterium]